MTHFKKLHECYAAYNRLNEAGLPLLKRKTELLIWDVTTLDHVAKLRDDDDASSERVYTKDGKFVIEWYWLDDEVSITTLDHAMQSGKRDHRVKLERLGGADDDAVVDYLNNKAKEFKSLEDFMAEIIKGDYDGHKEAGVEIQVDTTMSGSLFSPTKAAELPRLRKLPDELSVDDMKAILANGQFGFLSARGTSLRITDVLKEIEGLMTHSASIEHYYPNDLTTASAAYTPRNGKLRDMKINLALR